MGADVHITETEQTQKTDENGNFRFIGVPIGTYILSVSHQTTKTPEKNHN